jgi:hypothetical protein
MCPTRPVTREVAGSSPVAPIPQGGRTARVLLAGIRCQMPIETPRLIRTRMQRRREKIRSGAARSSSTRTRAVDRVPKICQGTCWVTSRVPQRSRRPRRGYGIATQALATTATDFACLSRFRPRPVCHRLRLVAPAGLHKGFILRCLLWLRPGAGAARISVARQGGPLCVSALRLSISRPFGGGAVCAQARRGRWLGGRV